MRIVVKLLPFLFLLTGCEENSAISQKEEASAEPVKAKTLRGERIERSGSLRERRNELVKADQLGPDALSAYFRKALEEDEDRSLLLLRDLTADINYDALGYALLCHYKERGQLKEGLEAFKVFSDNETLATPLLEHFAAAYWEKEPEKTLDWLIENGEISGIENAIHLIGIRSGGSDVRLRHLDEVLGSNLSEDARSAFLHGAIKEWMMSDFESAFTYVNGLPADEVIDQTIYHMVGKAAKHNVQAAMAWAQSITDEGLRISAVQEVADRWREDAPLEYQKWAEAE